jgi:transposase-like protein
VPTDIIFLVVFWRLRYKLSLRDLAEMFLIRGFVFTHEAVRDWKAKLAPLLAEGLRKRRAGKAGRCWHVGETYLKIAGEWCYLYRAIDRDGSLVDVYLSENRDMAAAKAVHRRGKVGSSKFCVDDQGVSIQDNIRVRHARALCSEGLQTQRVHTFHV